MIHTEEYELPTYWAPYLINGDSSHMTDEEIQLCDRRTKYLGHCAGMSEETWFGRYAGLGQDMGTYTFYKTAEKMQHL